MNDGRQRSLTFFTNATVFVRLTKKLRAYFEQDLLGTHSESFQVTLHQVVDLKNTRKSVTATNGGKVKKITLKLAETSFNEIFVTEY
ncbi:hypothetical protein CEXT_790641 [Caerostris extrusa]|uniref:Uncharacterized protein n=1 Tax=Caerostris extrusa TaxID=172846 RepID=A0AAV4XCC2_CAEEX|nr:hypothetical protein CEXT_790641 [Caerostris extrusa]